MAVFSKLPSIAMNVLVVYAHPEPRSFTGALKDAGVQALTEQGHQVLVSDLYSIGFNPVPGWHDFVDHDRLEFFGYEAEQKRATAVGSFAPDLRLEMEKLAQADLLILLFPLWWYGFPAILKGWVDRVFAAGFAYGSGRWYSEGVFRGKRAMLAFTTGGPATAYSADGLQGDVARIVYPIHHGILHYTGFDVLEPFVAFGASYAEPESRAAILASFEARLKGLELEAGTPPPDLDEFDEGLRRK